MAKRPRSPAQQAASRANGARSRGPKTAGGKARSRRNALRHGLRATVLEVLPLAVGGPTEQLVAAVHAHLAPTDVIETELADGIAVALWRLRRARELETELMRADATGGPGAGGRGLASGEMAPLAAALMKRHHGVGAMALLLRYRNQALGELDRLLRLLEPRRPAGEARQALAGLRQGAAPTPIAAALPKGANDNDRPGAAEGGPPLS